jgi:hypothetical protein
MQSLLVEPLQVKQATLQSNKHSLLLGPVHVKHALLQEVHLFVIESRKYPLEGHVASQVFWLGEGWRKKPFSQLWHSLMEGPVQVAQIMLQEEQVPVPVLW